MLNAISTSLVAYLLRRAAVREPGSNVIATKEIPEGSWIPGFSLTSQAGTEVYGFLFIAIVMGIGYWIMLNRTRFGFDLRATGQSETAAVASGMSVGALKAATHRALKTLRKLFESQGSKP